MRVETGAVMQKACVLFAHCCVLCPRGPLPPPSPLHPQVGDKMKVMILSMDKDRGRVTLSTKKLEKEPGDMLRDPQLVFEGAEAMAAAFKERVNTSEGGFLDDDMAAAAGAQGGNDGAAAPGGSGPADASGQQQYAFDTNP